MTDAAATDRLYFRQLLAGRDIATTDPLARQMVNFVYLIGDRETGEAVAIDPAYDVQGIVDVLAADDMRLTGVLATHYHPDHVGGEMMGYSIQGVHELLDIVSVPVHVQTEEAEYVRKVTNLTDADLVTHRSGDRVMVGEIPIELIHTPGHTPGSQCFMLDDLPGGDPLALYESLTQRLSKVPDDSLLFPGHLYSAAPCASMGETRQVNFVFRPKTPEQWLAMFGN